MWSYSGNPSSTPLDTVRFTIGDTESVFPLITNEEITYCLTQKNDDVLRASILCLEGIVRKQAKNVDYKLGPESVNASDRYKQLKEVLSALKSQLSSALACPSAELPTTDSAFDIGMHDFN